MYEYEYYTNLANRIITPEIKETFIQVLNVFLVIYLVALIIKLVSYWKLFKKAGRHGWAAIIPMYNMVVLYQVAKVTPWLIILLFIPIVNFVAFIVLKALLCVKIPKAFGKGSLYVIGLLFLPVIFYPMLAFGKAKYQK